MSPSYAVKKGLRYRYYVSTALVQGRKADAGSVPRVAAEAIEAAVCEALATADPHQQPITRESLECHVERITIAVGRISIEFTPEAVTSAAMPNPLNPRVVAADAAAQAGDHRQGGCNHQLKPADPQRGTVALARWHRAGAALARCHYGGAHRRRGSAS